MTQHDEPINVFLSYAPEDEDRLRRLETHLTLLQRQGVISLWHNRKIVAGADWTKTIDEHLEQAHIILLLVSADFLASDYCYGIEMTRALERYQAGQARVIPIIVRPVDWHNAPFGHLQCLPRDGQPVSKSKNKDDAFLEIEQGLRRVIEELRTFQIVIVPPPPPPPPHPHKSLFLSRGKAALLAGLVLLFVLGATLTTFFVKWQPVTFHPIATATTPLSPTVTGTTHPSPTSDPTPLAKVPSGPTPDPTTPIPALPISSWLHGFCNDVKAQDYTSAYSKMTGNPLKYQALGKSTYIQCDPTDIHQISSVSTHATLKMATDDGAPPYYRYISVTGSNSSTWKISQWYDNKPPNW